jgi:hypothetical protein
LSKEDVRMARSGDDQPSGWVGMAIFVASAAGLVAFDVTTWGWITLILGIVQIGVGLGILAGQSWALILGVIVAVLNAFNQIAFLPAQPVWSTIIIAIDVLIIYGLTAHGREIRGMS